MEKRVEFYFLLTNCVIHLKRIETFHPVADGVHLDRVSLPGRHIRHLGLRLADTRQLHPPRVVLRPISYRELGIQGIRGRLPTNHHGVPRSHFLDG